MRLNKAASSEQCWSVVISRAAAAQLTAFRSGCVVAICGDTIDRDRPGRQAQLVGTLTSPPDRCLSSCLRSLASSAASEAEMAFTGACTDGGDKILPKEARMSGHPLRHHIS